MKGKILLVYGGSNSGKSEFAENLACQEEGVRVYLATMDSTADYNHATIARHRENRKDKGFITVECPYFLQEALPKIKDLGQKKEGTGCTVLLECLSNLLANQVFATEVPDWQHLQDNLESILGIAEHCRKLIVVGNILSEEGKAYSPETVEYIRLLEKHQKEIAKLADEVYEVVAGIPCKVK